MNALEKISLFYNFWLKKKTVYEASMFPLTDLIMTQHISLRKHHQSKNRMRFNGNQQTGSDVILVNQQTGSDVILVKDDW